MRKAGGAVLEGHFPSAVWEEGGPHGSHRWPLWITGGDRGGVCKLFSLLYGAGCLSKQGITQLNPAHPEKIKLLSQVKTYTAIEQEHCLHLKTQL